MKWIHVLILLNNQSFLAVFSRRKKFTKTKNFPYIYWHVYINSK